MGKRWKQCQTLFSWATDGDCSHEIKRRLLLRRKSITNLDSILKSRDITLPTKVHLIKAMVFPVVMYGCKRPQESWALKNWGFWTVVLEKTLERVLWTAEIKPVSPKRNQSWIFIGRTDAEAEAPILCIGHLMRRTDSLEKTLMLGKIKGRRRRGRQRMRCLDGITDLIWVWASSGSWWWWTGKPGVLQSMGVTKSRTQLSNWTEQPLTQVLSSSSWDYIGRTSQISNYLQDFPDPSWLVLWLNLSLMLITCSPFQSNFTQLPCFKQMNSFICVQFGSFRLFTATLWASLGSPSIQLAPSKSPACPFPIALVCWLPLIWCDRNNLAVGTGRTIHHLPWMTIGTWTCRFSCLNLSFFLRKIGA